MGKYGKAFVPSGVFAPGELVELFDDVNMRGEPVQSVEAGDDGSVAVEGLEPGRQYWAASGVWGPVSAIATAPPAADEPAPDTAKDSGMRSTATSRPGVDPSRSAASKKAAATRKANAAKAKPKPKRKAKPAAKSKPASKQK